MSVKKQKLLFKLLTKIIKLKKVYLKKTNRYQKLNNTTEVIIIGSGTLATATLIMSFSVVASPLLIVSVCCSTIATLGTALKRASNIQIKSDKHKATYLAYSELEREVRLKITNNGLSDEQYDYFFVDLHNRMSLIEDNSIPVESSGLSEMNLSLSPKS
jgi:hypothetical protein